MLEKVPFEVGEEAIVDLSRSDEGYSPKIPNGSVVVVLGYESMPYGRTNNFGRAPGMYENPSWVKIRCVETGVHACEYAGRLRAVVAKERCERRDRFKVVDLPETPFYEGDIVRMTTWPDESRQIMTVDHIDYLQLADKRSDGSPYPAYQVQIPGGGYTYANADDLVLVSRGNVWKYFHDEKLEFKDLREEGEFFALLGHTSDVRNPATEKYSWTLPEVLKAIQDDVADAFKMGGALFGLGASIDAIRYRDRDLGRRIAALTLEEFPKEVTSLNP